MDGKSARIQVLLIYKIYIFKYVLKYVYRHFIVILLKAQQQG